MRDNGHDLTATEASARAAQLRGVVPPLSQFELIEAVARKSSEMTREWLEPLLKRLEDRNRIGVLIGARAILIYMGRKFKDGEGTASLPGMTVNRWHLRWGFPATKNWQGKWWSSKTLIDNWMVQLNLLSRKLVELGHKCQTGKTRGRCVEEFPWRFSGKAIAHAQRELVKDRAEAAING